jgi:hypothetical protein
MRTCTDFGGSFDGCLVMLPYTSLEAYCQTQPETEVNLSASTPSPSTNTPSRLHNNNTFNFASSSQIADNDVIIELAGQPILHSSELVLTAKQEKSPSNTRFSTTATTQQQQQQQQQRPHHSSMPAIAREIATELVTSAKNAPMAATNELQGIKKHKPLKYGQKIELSRNKNPPIKIKLERMVRTNKLLWTAELHRIFLHAVRKLGMECKSSCSLSFLLHLY